MNEMLGGGEIYLLLRKSQIIQADVLNCIINNLSWYSLEVVATSTINIPMEQDFWT